MRSPRPTVGDGRWRCKCGAGEYESHDEECIECFSCQGLGYHFVAANELYMTESTATCRACSGWGRVMVEKGAGGK